MIFNKCNKSSGISNISIKKVLFFTYMIIIMPPLIIQLIMNTNLVNTYKQELVASNMQFVNEYKLQIDYNFKEILSTLIGISSSNDFIGILDDMGNKSEYNKYQDQLLMQTHIQQVLYKYYIMGVYIYSKSGVNYIGNSNNGIVDVVVSAQNSQWLNSIKPTGKDFMYIGTHNPKQLLSGMPVVSITKSLFDPNTGKYLGLMLIDINPEMLGSTSTNKDSTLGKEFVVIDQNQNIVYHTNKELIMTKLYGNTLNKIFESTEGYYIYEDNKKRFLVSYNTLNVSDWKVAVITPLETVVKKTDAIKSTLLLFGIISILFAFIFSYSFSAFISNPIKKLTNKMKLVENGDFDASCNIKSIKEISILGEGFNSMIIKIRKLLTNEYQLKLLKKDAELKALQAQINPHFLYNTLETISAMADIKKTADISKTCRMLANMFRYSISTKTSTVSILEEAEHLQDYISIINLRFGDAIEFQINMTPELYDYEILKLTIQPLIENCINHGLSDIVEKGLVIVSILKKDDNIIIEISDNGKGIDPEKQKVLTAMIINSDINNITEEWQDSKDSIGLRNIHLRLSGYYGKQFGIISVQSSPGNGTKILLKVPAVKTKEEY